MKIFPFLCALSFAACTNHDQQKIPIAILTPVTHPSLEQIEKGFKETVEKESPGKYRFVTYNAQGNKTLMRGEVEEIARKNFPLVFTIGTLSSQMTKEVFAKKGLNTPIVFTAVDDPEESQLVPDRNITGVKELIDPRTQLQLAIQYKPNMKSLLLVFNPMEPGISKNAQEVQQILQERGIEFIPLEIFQTNEIFIKASPMVPKADGVLVLKDNMVVGGLDALIKLCNQYRVPLIATDLDSSDRGAAFAYGVHEVEFGIEAAKKAMTILNHNLKPQQIPVTPVSQFVFKINPTAAKQQGIELQEATP
jgi:putative ABC transport system substrate-binding protein